MVKKMSSVELRDKSTDLTSIQTDHQPLAVEEKVRQHGRDFDEETGSQESHNSNGNNSFDATKTSVPKQPSYKELLKYAVPCLSLWIAQPLMSLVDTVTVGLSAKNGTGAIQLAALGPAISLIEVTLYLFMFLNVATTNLYASAWSAARQSLPENFDERQEDIANRIKQAGYGVVRTAIPLAFCSGSVAMVTLFFVSEPLIRTFLEAGEDDNTIVGPSSEYVNIRAISLPTSLFFTVVQAALLGCKDSMSPLLGIVTSVILNGLLDIVFVVWLKMEVKGAAIATTVAQLAGTLAMLLPLKQKLVPTTRESRKSSPSCSVKSFLLFAAPVLSLVVCKVVVFFTLSQVAASISERAYSSGTEKDGVILAAHQVALSVFLFVNVFLEVTSTTVQVFLAPFYTARDEANKQEKQEDVQDCEKGCDLLKLKFLFMGFSCSGVMGFIASLILWFAPQLISNDSSVQEVVSSLGWPVLMASLSTAPVSTCEGIMIASQDFVFLVGVYFVSLVLFPLLLVFVIKNNVSSTLSDAWWGFVICLVFRGVLFSGRVWWHKIRLLPKKFSVN